MHMRTVLSTLLIGLFLLSGQTWGMGFILGQTKEELKLQYDVTVHDPGTGRVIVVLTLVDEGRLKPLDAVELIVPCKEQDPGGGRGVDLSVSVRLTKDAQGKQTARFEITKEMAGRAEVWLTTTTMDGKRMVMERSHSNRQVPQTTSQGESRAAGGERAGRRGAAASGQGLMARAMRNRQVRRERRGR